MLKQGHSPQGTPLLHSHSLSRQVPPSFHVSFRLYWLSELRAVLQQSLHRRESEDDKGMLSRRVEMGRIYAASSSRVFLKSPAYTCLKTAYAVF